MEITVPLGTVVHRDNVRGERTYLPVAEMLQEGERVCLAQGGKGGRGNASFATSTQQAPYMAERGEHGEELRCRLELRLLADVGIIGKPNAGKSTLLSAVSAATPKVGAYAFTTTEPVLGVAEVDWRRIVLMEVPGLVEGASMGLGMGHAFLRHATRARVLLHLVDGSLQDVGGSVREVNGELAAYGAGLEEKPQVLVVNKIDLSEVAGRRAEIAAELGDSQAPLFFISAAGRIDIEPVIRKAAEMLSRVAPPEPVTQEAPPPRVRRQQRQPLVALEDGVFVVADDQAERLVAGSDLRVWAGRMQLKGQMDYLGVTKALEEAGVQPGNTVRFGDIELEW